MSFQGNKYLAKSAPFGLKNAPSSVPHDVTTVDLFERCTRDEAFRTQQIYRFVFSPDVWLFVFLYYTNNHALKAYLRVAVQVDTLVSFLRCKYYRLVNGLVVSCHLSKRKLLDSIRATEMVRNTEELPMPTHKESWSQVSVVEGDCIDVALHFKKEFFFKPLVLVMGSTSHPGGGYEYGAGAQEESLCRRTSLLFSLYDPYSAHPSRDWSYPIPNSGAIYCPRVAVIRGSEAEGYPYLEQVETLDFINVPALRDPPLETLANGELVITGSALRDTKKRIRSILKVAAVKGHDCVVLSAFGCGAYGNPPRHIARLFKEIIRTEFEHSFKMIVFAIINDSNAMKAHNPQGNVIPFAEVFESPALTLEQMQL